MLLSFWVEHRKEKMTTARAKHLAKVWAKKELKYVKNHKYDITMSIGTIGLSGFVFSILSNL
jgi:hypothetical protein